jgi:hypothetical protein
MKTIAAALRKEVFRVRGHFAIFGNTRNAMHYKERVLALFLAYPRQQRNPKISETRRNERIWM